jgi:hypothetical protein
VESVRQSLMKFALSFLVVGDTDTISSLLQVKGSKAIVSQCGVSRYEGLSPVVT